MRYEMPAQIQAPRAAPTMSPVNASRSFMMVESQRTALRGAPRLPAAILQASQAPSSTRFTCPPPARTSRDLSGPTSSAAAHRATSGTRPSRTCRARSLRLAYCDESTSRVGRGSPGGLLTEFGEREAVLPEMPVGLRGLVHAPRE